MNTADVCFELAKNVVQRYFKHFCFDTWPLSSFSVDITCLGSMLSQIAVCLQPLLTVHPDQVLQIFQFLIVDNRSVGKT